MKWEDLADHVLSYQFAAAHAPKGGATVGGKQFTGGEFIPAEVMAKATPEEKAKLNGKSGGEKFVESAASKVGDLGAKKKGGGSPSMDALKAHVAGEKAAKAKKSDTDAWNGLFSDGGMTDKADKSPVWTNTSEKQESGKSVVSRIGETLHKIVGFFHSSANAHKAKATADNLDAIWDEISGDEKAETERQAKDIDSGKDKAWKETDDGWEEVK